MKKLYMEPSISLEAVYAEDIITLSMGADPAEGDNNNNTADWNDGIIF